MGREGSDYVIAAAPSRIPGSSAMDNEMVEIAAMLRHETDKAYLLFDGVREAWVPKSQVEDNGDGTFTMPTWLAQQREFI